MCFQSSGAARGDVMIRTSAHKLVTGTLAPSPNGSKFKEVCRSGLWLSLLTRYVDVLRLRDMNGVSETHGSGGRAGSGSILGLLGRSRVLCLTLSMHSLGGRTMGAQA